MHRLVTQDDLARYPQLQKMGVSANQNFDFTNLEPLPNTYSTDDYDISESTPVDYGIFKPKVEPKKWTKYLDKIYVINLAKRKDRMLQAVQQLNKYSIPFERVEAIPHENGAEGLRLTMDKLFKSCIKNNYENVLVLEDDLDIIEPTINEVMQKVMAKLPPQYDLIFLGAQLCAKPIGFAHYNLLKGVQHAFATHAVIYSLKAMKDIVKGKMTAPVDNWIVANIQQKQNTYAVYPMLISQIVGHSDIYSDKPITDWKMYLEGKFYEMTKHLVRNHG